jgi:RNA 2',3'-cyclic 3'-phosphodiesterase
MHSAGSGPAIRLFLALWPHEDLRDCIVRWRKHWSWTPPAALVRPERLHLTLHFLGDVPPQGVPELVEGLTTKFQPFELPLERAEVWPNGVAVLQPDHTPSALLELHAGLCNDLLALGLRTEARSYRPHVTLARRAWGSRPPAAGAGLRWHADSGYVLVRSLPGGGGYHVLEGFR